MLPEDRRAALHGENRGRRGRPVLSGSGVVLELRKGLQRVSVAPGSTICLFFTWSELKGTTTYFEPIPRKPPTDSTAKGTFSVGVTIRSSIVPTVSLASLTTVLPTTFDVR